VEVETVMETAEGVSLETETVVMGTVEETPQVKGAMVLVTGTATAIPKVKGMVTARATIGATVTAAPMATAGVTVTATSTATPGATGLGAEVRATEARAVVGIRGYVQKWLMTVQNCTVSVPAIRQITYVTWSHNVADVEGPQPFSRSADLHHGLIVALFPRCPYSPLNVTR
jgi:hypothetical protein